MYGIAKSSTPNTWAKTRSRNPQQPPIWSTNTPSIRQGRLSPRNRLDKKNEYTGFNKGIFSEADHLVERPKGGREPPDPIRPERRPPNGGVKMVRTELCRQKALTASLTRCEWPTLFMCFFPIPLGLPATLKRRYHRQSPVGQLMLTATSTPIKPEHSQDKAQDAPSKPSLGGSLKN